VRVPLSTTRSNVSVAAVPPVSTGAMNVALAVLAPVSATGGPDVCVHEYVSGLVGVLKSWPLPLKGTAAAEATVCPPAASAVGARTGGASTVTVVDTLTSSSGTPLLMVSSKVSVTGAAPFGKAGALNVGCATLALDSVTIGVPPVCRQENVSVRAGELW